MILLLFVGAGCSSTKTISNPEQESSQLLRLQREATGKTVEIRAHNARYWSEATLVDVQPDTTVWIDSYGTRFAMPTAYLSAITYHRRSARGVLHGGAIGLGIAGFAGVLGALSYDEDDSDSLVTSRGEAAGITALVVGIVTVPVGMLIGIVGKQKITYRFKTDGPVSRASTVADQGEGNR